MGPLHFCLSWIAVLCLVCQAHRAPECFAWPKDFDFSQLLAPMALSTAVGHHQTSASSDTISNLFDKSLDTAVQFKGLKLSFPIADTLPELGRIQIIGTGTVNITLSADGHSTVTSVALSATTPTTVQALNEGRVEGVVISSTDASISDLQFISREQHEGDHDEAETSDSSLGYDDSSGSDPDADDVYADGDDTYNEDDASSDVGSSEDTTYDGSSSYDEDAIEDAPSTTVGDEVKGCQCAGFPADEPRGRSCGEWDEDCKGEGGWCYVKPGACPGAKPSSTHRGWEWSCAPCHGGPSTPAGQLSTPATAATATTAEQPATAPSSVSGDSSDIAPPSSEAIAKVVAPSETGSEKPTHPPVPKEEEKAPESKTAAHLPECSSCLWVALLCLFAGLGVGLLVMFLAMQYFFAHQAPTKLDEAPFSEL